MAAHCPAYDNKSVNKVIAMLLMVACLVVAQPMPPTVPVSGLEVQEVVMLAWDASVGATGYHIWTNGVRLTTTTNTQVTFLAPPDRWTNQVSAFNTSGESARATLVWPPVITNVVTVASVWGSTALGSPKATNWSITFTNPETAPSKFYWHTIKMHPL